MIKFFRHIRRSLINQNNMGKYLKYAIGEVLLVVIGILIALGINNWNEERLEQKTEGKILQDLKVEFTANLNDINRVLEQHKVVFNEFNQIQRITVAEDYSNEELDSLLYSIPKWFSFTQRPGASENLINSGKLNIISNKNLRDLITQWSGIVDDVIDDEQFSIDFTKDTFLPFLARHYPATNFEYSSELFFKTYTLSTLKNTKPIIQHKEVDWKKLLNNMEFQSLLSLRKTTVMHTISEVEVALTACKEILNLLNNELEQ